MIRLHPARVHNERRMSSSGKSADPFRWGIVGTGTMARHFADDAGLAGMEIAGIVSRSPDRAEAFGTKHGGRAHTSIASLVEDPAVEAVYVATPNDRHFHDARETLLAGLPTLVEKPLATSAEEVEQLTETARFGGTLLMEGLWTRFLPSFEYLRTAIEANLIGKVRRVRAELAFDHSSTPERAVFDSGRGGGALLDLGIYPISLAIALFGTPSRIEGACQRSLGSVETSASVRLEFGDIVCDFECALDREGTNLFVVEGTTGSIVLQAPFIGARSVVRVSSNVPYTSLLTEGRTSVARAFRKLARTIPVPGIERRAMNFEGYGLSFEARAFAENVRGCEGAVAPHSLEDSLLAARVIDALRTPSG